MTFHISMFVFVLSERSRVYFHIFLVKNHNSDETISPVLTFDFQIQSHALFRVTSHIPVCIRASERSRCLFRNNYVEDHTDEIANTAISSIKLSTVYLQIQGHSLFCVTFHIVVAFFGSQSSVILAMPP